MPRMPKLREAPTEAAQQAIQDRLSASTTEPGDLPHSGPFPWSYKVISGRFHAAAEAATRI